MAKITECIMCRKKCVENKFNPDATLCRNCEEERHLKKQGVNTHKCANCGKVHIKNSKEIKCECGWITKFVEDLPEEVLQKNVTDSAGIKKEYHYQGYSGPQYTTCHIKCIHCGKEFQSKRSDAKTCSTKCRVATNRRLNHETPTQKAATDMKLRIKSLITILLPPDLADELNKKIDERIKN